MSITYRGLSETAWNSYSNWQKSLVAKNRKNENGGVVPPARTRIQQEFLSIVAKSRRRLIAEMRKALDCSSELSLDCSILSSDLSTDMIWNPQMDWEQMVHSSLSNPPNGASPATRNDAAQVLFWVICHVAWLDAGHLQDPPIAALTKRRFGRALLRLDPESLSNTQRIQLDNVTRDVLRSLGGIPHVRSSHIHHLMDCPSARAWWRIEISHQAVTGSEGALFLSDCYEVFRQPSLWAAWAETAMTRTGTLSVDACSAAFVEAIRRYQAIHSSFPNKQQSQDLIKNMARRTTNVYPKMLPYQRLADLCAD